MKSIHTRIVLARIALALILLCVAASSTFGFLATYEPMDDGSHLTWRIGYGIAIAASILTAVWILMSVVRIHRNGSR